MERNKVVLFFNAMLDKDGSFVQRKGSKHILLSTPYPQYVSIDSEGPDRTSNSLVECEVDIGM